MSWIQCEYDRHWVDLSNIHTPVLDQPGSVYQGCLSKIDKDVNQILGGMSLDAGNFT